MDMQKQSTPIAPPIIMAATTLEPGVRNWQHLNENWHTQNWMKCMWIAKDSCIL